MKVQRRDSRRVEQALYDGAGILGLEEYFAESTRLTSSVLRYHFEPGTSGACTGTTPRLPTAAPGGLRRAVPGPQR